MMTDELTWQQKQERLKARKPLERTVRLFSEEQATALDVAKEKLQRLEATSSSDEDLQAARDEVEKAAREHEETSIPYTLRGVSEDVWEELAGKCPPTDAQAKKGDPYDPKKFAPMLLAASLVDDVEVDDVRAMFKRLSPGDTALLVSTAVQLSQRPAGTVGKD